MFRYPRYNEPYLKQIRQSSLSPFDWKYKQSLIFFEFFIDTLPTKCHSQAIFSL